MIKIIKNELGYIREQVKSATGVNLSYAVDRRISKRFNPEDIDDLLSMYPSGFLTAIKEGKDFNHMINSYSDGETDISDVVPEMVFHSEDGETEDCTLETLFTNDMYQFFRENESFRSLTLCIDEQYLQTIKDKLAVGALEYDNLLSKVSNDLVPFIYRYLQTIYRQLKPIRDILNNITCNTKAQLVLNGTFLSMDYTLIKDRFYGYDHHTSAIRNDLTLRKYMIALIIFELLNDLVKGRKEILDRLETTIRFLISKIIDGSKLNKFFGVETVVRNIFSNSNYRGAMFDRLINVIMNDARGNVMDLYGVNNAIEIFNIENRKDDDDEKKYAYKRILSSKFLLQYAESLDIMNAISSIPKSEIHLYIEGFFASDDDLDKEMNIVNDMARRAAICKIDLEYITTKYSKKDAINNAYMCLEDIRDARKKLKFKQSIEMLDAVTDALMKDIKTAQSYDHKKSRMTINIQYPQGYEG